MTQQIESHCFSSGVKKILVLDGLKKTWMDRKKRVGWGERKKVVPPTNSYLSMAKIFELRNCLHTILPEDDYLWTLKYERKNKNIYTCCINLLPKILNHLFLDTDFHFP